MITARAAGLRTIGPAIFAILLASSPVVAQQDAPAANGPLALQGADLSSPVQPVSTGSIQSTDSTPGLKPTERAPFSPAGLTPVLVVPPAAIQPRPAETAALHLPEAVQEHKSLGGTAGSTKRIADGSKTNASSSLWGGSDMTKVLGALGIVVGLILLVRAALKRTGTWLPSGDRPSGVVEILARFPVARGQQLILLKLARRILLLHQSGSNMTALSEMTDPEEVAALLGRMEAGATGRSAARFSQVLRGFEAEHAQPEIHVSRARTLPSQPQPEIIDLTRSQMRGLSSLLTRKAGR